MDLNREDVTAFALAAPRDRTAAEPLEFAPGTFGEAWVPALKSRIQKQSHLYPYVEFFL